MNFRQTIDGLRDFVGLMGMCEMELACAKIVNKSKYDNVALSRVRFVEENFDEGYERDGFHELHRHDWIEPAPGGRWKCTEALLNRLRKRLAKLHTKAAC